MRKLARSLRQNRQGVAALEFALIAPMYLLLLLGIVAYGLYCTVQIAVTVAASEGARAAVGALPLSAAANQASKTACAVLNAYAPLLTCDPSNFTASGITAVQAGTQVTVTVTYPYAGTNFIPIVPLPTTSPTYTAIATVSAY